MSEEKVFFKKKQAYELILRMIDAKVIYFPVGEESRKWMSNEERIERLDAIGEVLLALLRQLTGRPEMKPSDAEGLIREIQKLEGSDQP